MPGNQPECCRGTWRWRRHRTPGRVPRWTPPRRTRRCWSSWLGTRWENGRWTGVFSNISSLRGKFKIVAYLYRFDRFHTNSYILAKQQWGEGKKYANGTSKNAMQKIPKNAYNCKKTKQHFALIFRTRKNHTFQTWKRRCAETFRSECMHSLRHSGTCVVINIAKGFKQLILKLREFKYFQEFLSQRDNFFEIMICLPEKTMFDTLENIYNDAKTKIRFKNMPPIFRATLLLSGDFLVCVWFYEFFWFFFSMISYLNAKFDILKKWYFF